MTTASPNTQAAGNPLAAAVNCRDKDILAMVR